MLTRMSFFEKNNEKAQRDGWALYIYQSPKGD